MSAFGHDCVMDPWYPLGSHDMLEVASYGFTCYSYDRGSRHEGMFQHNNKPAKTMHLENYGLKKAVMEI